MANYNACKLFYFGPEEPDLQENADINLQWIPLVHISPIENSGKEILDAIEKCDYIIFTSPRGVRITKELFYKQGLLSSILNSLSEKSIIVIGGSTGKAVENEFYIKPCCLPIEWDSWGLGDLLCEIHPRCSLLLRARQASSILEEKLKDCNIHYRKVALYDVIPMNKVRGIVIPKGSPIILSSSLIARIFIEYYGCPNDSPLIALGRTTLKTINNMCSSVTVYIPSRPLLEEAIILARNIACNAREKIKDKNKLL
ncbi:MAG: uroporphyrinogen-III synthase [Desulfurococcales archaeon]|nr:uroporphyrinogen-III synthase [Desulfurococcales archaeon]